MKFHFSRGFVSKTDKPLTYQESLMLDLQKTRCELEDAYAGFDYVTDPDLIDCYIYEQNAVMKRYRYLLQQAAGLSAVRPFPGRACFRRSRFGRASLRRIFLCEARFCQADSRWITSGHQKTSVQNTTDKKPLRADSLSGPVRRGLFLRKQKSQHSMPEDQR